MMNVLKDVAFIQSGYQSHKKIADDVKGSHCLLLGTDLNRAGMPLWHKLTRFSPERNPDAYEIRPGDILFQARGIENFPALITHLPTNILISNAFYIIRPDTTKILPGFLVWWFQQAQCLRYLKEMKGVAVTSFVKKETLVKLPVCLPHLQVQEKIQRVIHLRRREQELMNKLIEKKERLVDGLCFKYIESQGE